MKISINNVIRDMTPDEEAEHNKLCQVGAEEMEKSKKVEQAKETNKASGNQKLLDLGLTQAEATALTGYTPPVAE
jgi:hypothetical protein